MKIRFTIDSETHRFLSRNDYELPFFPRPGDILEVCGVEINVGRSSFDMKQNVVLLEGSVSEDSIVEEIDAFMAEGWFISER
jgi:hypothetical protein